MQPAVTLPTPKLEAWKFTHLARAVAALPAQTAPKLTLAELEACLPVVRGPQLVLQDGVLVPELSQLADLPAGVVQTVATLPPVDAPRDGLDSLPLGPVLRLQLSGTVAGVVQVIHVLSDPQVPATGLWLEVAAGATATVLEQVVAPAGWVGFQHQRVLLTLGAGARLTHSVLNLLPPTAVWSRRQQTSVGDGVTYAGSQLQAGGQLVRLEQHATLAARADFKLLGLTLGAGTQHLDTTTTLAHAGVGNQTEIKQRNLLLDSAVAVFQGKFYVAPEAQQTNAYMHNHTLLLSDTARTSHKPELEIYADDVKCSHGAATGGLAPEQLFYLRARGLTAAAAQSLLVAGSAQEFMAGFPLPVQGQLHDTLQRWLGHPVPPSTLPLAGDDDAAWLEQGGVV